MSHEWRGPINSLADAFRARRHLWVLCKGCGHVALVDPRNLIGKLGEMSFEETRHKLRCAKCGKVRIPVKMIG
jgi:uncharacterized OB-fold protein